MTTKLPPQEEFENWTAFQVADLLRQFGMSESAVVVEKLCMNGSRFLNASAHELSRFKTMHQPSGEEEGNEAPHLSPQPVKSPVGRTGDSERLTGPGTARWARPLQAPPQLPRASAAGPLLSSSQPARPGRSSAPPSQRGPAAPAAPAVGADQWDPAPPFPKAPPRLPPPQPPVRAPGGAGPAKPRVPPLPVPAGGTGRGEAPAARRDPAEGEPGPGKRRRRQVPGRGQRVPGGAALTGMDKLNRLTVPAGEKFRKLQKMVHDIKKNESGIINKFKKFQNEQVALICKTGKDTWDRLKKKPPPSLPQRDYASEHADNEEEQWSDDFDSDYENPDDHSDSEMYVVPSEENPDDSYEPPPSEKEKKKIPSAFPISRGEYADNRPSHQKLPPINKPLPTTPSPAMSRPKKPCVPSMPLPSPAAKPKVPPKPKECSDDEDNYIVPVDNDDDNYIQPTEDSMSLPTRSPVNRFMKTTKPAPPISPKPSLTSDMQEVYEVPEEEEKPSPPPVTRFTKPLMFMPAQSTEHSHMHSMTRESPKQDNSRNILPLPRSRLHPKPDHEANNNDESQRFNNTQESRFPTGAAPSPLPRGLKKTSNAVISPKPCLPSRETLTANEEKPMVPERRRNSSQELPLPPLPSGAQKPLLQKPSILPKVPEAANRSLGASPPSSISSVSSSADQDAGVHSKAWYAATCDRKMAEDALYRSNKDGSFLIRKSSGQDSRQPYTLVVFYNRRVYNIPIRFIESTRQYALGREKSGEERFDSVAEIVENHQRTSLVLIDSQNNTKDSTKLKYIVRVS